MKGRLNSTVTLVVLVDLVALVGVLFLAYSAGQISPKAGILEFGNQDASTGMKVVIGIVMCLGAACFTWFTLTNKVLAPVKKLADFSERLARADFRSRADVESSDDFGFIAENFNRAAEQSSRAMLNQEAQENLQKSVTEFLTVVSQIARGDLTLRGRVTSDALGNVVDSVNYMLDNF